MVRRRTAVSIAAAALLLASPALTACGSGPARPGAAAVIGDQKITVSTLQAQVNDLRKVGAGSPQGQQLLNNTSDLPQKLLNRLVSGEVMDKALADEKLSVSDSEVQQFRAASLRQFGGTQAQFDETLLGQLGVTPASSDRYFYEQLAAAKLISKLGFQVGSDGGNTALTADLAKTAASLGVRINPRYGAWDAKTAAIDAQKDPWVVNKTPVASESGTAGA